MDIRDWILACAGMTGEHTHFSWRWLTWMGVDEIGYETGKGYDKYLEENADKINEYNRHIRVLE